MSDGNGLFAGFVMTYRRPKILARTLEALLGQTRVPELLLVVDNAASPATEEVVAGCQTDRVVYHPMAENLGPAGAAKTALQRLTRLGFDWIYWGDDDDPPRMPDDLETLLGFAREGKFQPDSRLAGVALSGVRWNWSTGAPQRIQDRELEGPVSLDAVPGSCQMILSSKAIRATGWPDERLFWGLEDYEYCLRLRREGYRIYAPGARMLENRRRAGRLDLQTGRSSVPKMLPKELPRAYYSTRNYVFLMRQTFGRPDLARRRMTKEAVRSAASWLRGPRFGASYTGWQLRAVRDALVGNMGRTVSLDGSGSLDGSVSLDDSEGDGSGGEAA